MVSTNEVLFFNFLTILGVPIMASICFSITKGGKFVIGVSSSGFITKNLAKLSEVFKYVEVVCSSSELGRCGLFVEVDCVTGGKLS